MSYNRPATTEASIKANPHCPVDQQINVLLLGQTGVGKSTFINAFANYLINDTLQEAERDAMKVVIPSSFSFTDPETFDERMIVIGNEDEYEQFKNVGQSNTLQCRSFVFPIGNRVLRFIDTPGIGDTRGIEQDEKNFQSILNYIAQFEHLNAVFILLKPNEERLTILFRFSVNELFRHLHKGAKDNLIFVFTNARSTFFMPGSSKKLLEGLLEKHRREQKVEVPFTRDNTFLFDSEAFRFLALRRNGIRLDNEQTQSYTKSWDSSVREYSRLMEHINSCDPHAVSNTISLNEAEQLVRKLPRPIAETTRLIEENIQLAKEHKKRVLENPQIASQGIPQKDVVVATLKYPRTVCTGEECCRITGEGMDQKMEYISICHDRCYLAGVPQETLADPSLRECEVMNADTGFCIACGCLWDEHKHITYECNTRLTHAGSATTSNTASNRELSLGDIDKRISDLRKEKRQIEDVYKKLVRFLHVNSLLPVNDDFAEYIQYFIREEQMKYNAGGSNKEIIGNLETAVKEYTNEMELLKNAVQEQKDAGEEIETIDPEEVFTLVGTLYDLPITGRQIRDQVQGIQINQGRFNAQREIQVELPAKAASSRIMLQLKDIVSRRRNQ